MLLFPAPSIRLLRSYTSPLGTGSPGILTCILPISPKVVINKVFQSSPAETHIGDVFAATQNSPQVFA